MLNENSFFKQIPLSIALEQRLLFEGAGWAIDIISWAFTKVKAAAEHINPHGPPFPQAAAQEIFACSWSIIDQCHMLRQLLANVGGPATAKFVEKYEAVTMIRNKMDHLRGNIKNIARNKSPMPPLIGALSFCSVSDVHLKCDADGATTLNGCHVITITAGAFTHPKHQVSTVNPAERKIELPVDLFEFHAFEHVVCFSDLVSDLAELVHHYDTVMKADRDDELRKFAQLNKLDEQKVLSEHVQRGLVLTMEIAFDPAAPSET